jgi:WD40 repeat protein
MKRLFLFATIVLTLLVQSACGTPAATQSPTSVSLPATPSLAPPTATPSPAPSPTATATLALPVAAGTAIPLPSEVLSKANIAGITEEARWGNGQVSDAAYSPDGKSIAVATALGVSIYGADTLSKKISFETKSPVNAIAFSPDGATLVTGLLDNSVTAWNAADGTMLKTYEGQKKVITDKKRAKEQVTAVAFSNDGSLLAAGSSEGFVNVWKTSDGSVVQTFTNHILQVTRVLFSIDGKAVFSASVDGTVRMTQLSDGKLLRAYGSVVVRDAAISKDGKTLATYNQDLFGSAGNLLLWDTESGKKLQTIKAGDYKAHVQRIAFSPDGQSIAAGWSDYSVKVWSVSDGSLLGNLEDLKPKTQLPKGWYFIVNPVVRFSPDGKNLMWAGDDSVAFLNPAGTTLEKKQVLATRSIYAIALSPDGQTLASNEALDVHLRHFADGSLYADQPKMTAFGNVAFAPDGNSIAVGFLDSSAEHSAALLWPVTSQGLKKSFDTSLNFAWSLVDFPPDGKTVALGVSREILIYNISDGALIRTVHSGLGSDFSGMAFSGDGTLLAVSAGNTTKLIQVEDGKSLKSYNNGGSAVAFAPDGTLLAGSDWQKNVRVWKVPTDQVVVTVADNTDVVSSLRFSKDGTMLVGGLRDGTIIVWSMTDGAVLKTWQAHAQGVSGLIFSPDGKLLISSSYDGTIRVWGLKP